MILLLAWHVLHGCTVGFASGTKGGLLPLWLAWGCAVQAGTGQNVSRSAPSACGKLRSQLMAQMLEHFAADEDDEH